MLKLSTITIIVLLAFSGAASAQTMGPQDVSTVDKFTGEREALMTAITVQDGVKFAMLILFCKKDGEPSIGVRSKHIIKPVYRFKVDDKEVTSITGGSDAWSTGFILNDGQVISLVEAMKAGSQILFEAKSSYNNSSIEAKTSLSGFTKAYRSSVGSECGEPMI